MTGFDKFCAVLCIPIGVVFMVLGALGTVFGSNAYLTLPPVLGALPFFLGWGMCVTLIRFWSQTNYVPRTLPRHGPGPAPTGAATTDGDAPRCEA